MAAVAELTRITLPPMPAKQIAIIEAEDDDLLIEGSPRSAKSWGVAAKIHLLAQKHPGIQIFYSRYKDESLGQLRDVWNKVLQLFPEWSHPKWNASDQSWDYGNPQGTPRGQHWGSKIWLSSIKSAELDLLHSKYKGKTLAVIVVEEAVELPKENWIGLRERLSQSKKPSGESYPYPLQFILVTNCVDEDHWLASEYPVEGLDPVTQRRTLRLSLYDNARNLGPEVMRRYEKDYPPGHALRRTVIEGQRGLTMLGTPVYGSVFDAETHVSQFVRYTPHYPILTAWDFGHTKPAISFWQHLTHIGALRCIGWIKGSELFLETFAQKVLEIRRRLFPGVPDSEFWEWADPTGATGNQGMAHTAVRHLHDLGIPVRFDPTSNRADVRYAAIQVIAGFMERVAKNGEPAFQMVPTGIELVKDGNLIVEKASTLFQIAFAAGYVWDDHAAPDANPNIRKPKKGTRYDDLCNTSEYVVIGERISVPTSQELWHADRRVAKVEARLAKAAIAASQRAEGPTGETLQEAEARLRRTLRTQPPDRDPMDRNRGQASRGGW